MRRRSLFPVGTVWTLALNNQLTVPPAYDAHARFLPDRRRSARRATSCRRAPSSGSSSRAPVLQPVAGRRSGVPRRAGRADGAARRATARVAWQLPFAEPLAVPPVWDNGWLVRRDRGRRGPRLSRHRRRAHLAPRSRIAGARAARRSPPIASTSRPTTAASSRCMSTDGDAVWERRLGGAANDILALDDRVYAGAQGQLLLLRDGQRRPRRLAVADRRRRRRRRRSSDETNVYFVALDNVLRALNRKSGGQQWMRPLPFRPVWAPVQVAGDDRRRRPVAIDLRAFKIE